MNTSSSPRALSIKDAARTYSIGRSTIYLLLKQEKLRDVKVLGRRVILVEDLERLIGGGGGVMKEPASPQEEFADRSADNYSPNNIRCRFCKWFYPYDPTNRNTGGEFRASLPQDKEIIGGTRLHEQFRSDHWCKKYEDGPFSERFRLLHHHSILDEYQNKFNESRFLQKENAVLEAEVED